MNYLTPRSEIEAWLKVCRPRRTFPGFGLEAFLAQRFLPGRYTDSLQGWRGGFEEWAGKLRPILEECLILPDAVGRPSEPVVLERTEERDCIIEEVEIGVTHPLRAPATVVIPRNGKKRHPAIVALHSLGGLRGFGREKLFSFEGEPEYLTEYREAHYSGRSLQRELARRGYLSIAIDAFNFGLRTAAAAEDLDGFLAQRLAWSAQEAEAFTMQASGVEEPRAVRALGCLGISVAAIVATDDLRTVDYLCTREDVDPGRIGATGLSFGSFRTNYLCALDARVRTGASVCWVSTMDGIVGYNEVGAMGFFALPADIYRRIDMPDLISLAAPKPFLAIGGWQDVLMQPSGTAAAHLALRDAWERAGAPDALGSLVFDAPHEYNAEMQQAAFDFFDRHLTGRQSPRTPGFDAT